MSLSDAQDWVERMRQSTVVFLIEILVGLLAIAGFVISLASISLSMREIRHAQVVNGWQILGTTSPGNSGKIEALTFLAGQGISRDGVDVSCTRMKGGVPVTRSRPWRAHNSRLAPLTVQEGAPAPPPAPCPIRTYLRALDLSPGAIGHRTSLKNANFGGTDLTGADLSEADMQAAILDHADLSGISMQNTNLRDASLIQTLGWPDLSSANLSGAQIIGSEIGRLDLKHDTLPLTISGSTVQHLKLDAERGSNAFSAYDSSIEVLEAPQAHLPALGGLDKAIILEADLSGSRGRALNDTESGPSVVFEDALFQNADFSGAILNGVVFRNVRIIDSNFANADFEGATLENVDITGTVFCDDSSCATGLNQNQLDQTFVMRGDGAGLDGTRAFGIRESASNSRSRIIDEVFSGAHYGRICVDTVHPSLEVVGQARRVSEMKLRCWPAP
ncbi:pentapeptide repeat-containing protein [Citreimonas salinaria]|uniref:Uncharacterized protein YjbI, contains pentapeptide repeats n=1 Tax=Citreimonas salinaria TaxID=321339 RepID=A0A1H3IQZ6_9RHOB|nr:pentapeptide repeat-containing protein [Citreimonas salinaria]SDY29745.1 Uncharacterized protein YjbI, contains pentapeptide repeats [Citreimonas salinaria]